MQVCLGFRVMWFWHHKLERSRLDAMFFALSLGVNWNNHYLPWRLSQIQPMVGPTRIIIGLTNINYRWRDLISKSMYSGKFSFFISFVLLKIRIESCI